MKEKVNKNELSPVKEPISGGKGRAVATIVVMAAVVVVLAVAGVKNIFFGDGEDADEIRAYEDIMRYEREHQLDSLHEALGQYFDLYNVDAFHFSQLKALNDEFAGEYDEWRTVERHLSLDGVRCFLDHYPDGRFREIAERCEDSLYYAWACGEGSAEAVELYLKYFVDGEYVEEAERRLEELRNGLAAEDGVKGDGENEEKTDVMNDGGMVKGDDNIVDKDVKEEKDVKEDKDVKEEKEAKEEKDVKEVYGLDDGWE